MEVKVKIEAVSIRRCQFCYHWQVIDRYLGNCDVMKEATHRSGCCTNWKGDAIAKK
jgi:hypothetical protein